MKKIIISRLDNIGDVILTFPLLSHLKAIYPESELIYIAKKYSAPILEGCKLVNHVIEWETLNNLDENSLSSMISEQLADIFINSTPKRKLARAAYRAKIPIRIGSTRRLYHWIYCNKRAWIPDHRHCLTHMADHFLALAKPISSSPLPEAASFSIASSLQFEAPLPETVKSKLSENRFNLILHPGSNNHAPEWPTAHFHSLIKLLPSDRFNILITGTTQEQERFEETLLSNLPEHAHNLMGTMDLPQFLSLISATDGTVASSTGPIHVSGVLDKKTLGLFPPRTPNSFDWELTDHKWKPLGQKVTTLTSTPSCNKACTTENFQTCHCMQAISPENVADILLEWLN